MPRKKPEPDPEDLTDAEMAEMIEQAGQIADTPRKITAHHRPQIERFQRILTFKIPLHQITHDELVAVLQYRVQMAKPYPV